MSTKMTSAGRLTIPKAVREHLGLMARAAVSFELYAAEEVVVRAAAGRPMSRFEKLRGRATIRMRTEDILLLARDD